MEQKYKAGETVAVVQWFRGDRRMDRMIKNAGLGIDAVGVEETSELVYKPGEVVDEARVMRALESMMAGLDSTEDAVRITRPKVISIRVIP